MKVLTITNRQTSEQDFCFGIEGEIAAPGQVTCSRHDCGCDRSHVGLNSRKAATTLMVREIDLSFDDIVTACVGYLESSPRAGVLTVPVEDIAYEMATDSTETAAMHAVGTVLRPSFDHNRDEWHYVNA